MAEGKRNYVGAKLQRVFDSIYNQDFGDVHVMHPILHSLANGGDYYITCFDFYQYIEAQ